MRPWGFAFFTVLVGCGSSVATPDASDDGGARDASGSDVVVDAPSSDAADTSVPADANADAGVLTPIPCGQTFCRVDQTCTAGKCAFACKGSTVPGDYATVQSAVDGLASVGNDATICLAEMNYPEGQLFVRDPGNHGKALRIVGPSMDRSKITAHSYWFGGWSAVTFQGVHLDGTNADALDADFATHGGKVSLIATRLSGQSGVQATAGSGKSGELFVDGCELSVGGGYGVDAFANGNAALKITVQNTYAHGAGCATQAGTMYQGTLDLVFVNNTIVNCQAGLQLDVAANMKALYANNIFTGSTMWAISRSGTGMNVTHQNNALWGNVTNYSGTVGDGVGYVKSDCLLDTTGPAPTLKQGSPCRGAGDTSVSPASDFFGVSRGTPADIGAVEAP
jgi:hypothetical protein